jgi:hypothetical protein
MKRVDYDETGNLDDVAVSNVSLFRLEYMDVNKIWIRLYRKGAPDLVIHLAASGKITGACFED